MHIDWSTLALQTINALVLVWLLARFLFRPVAEIVAERQDAARNADRRCERGGGRRLTRREAAAREEAERIAGARARRAERRSNRRPPRRKRPCCSRTHAQMPKSCAPTLQPKSRRAARRLCVAQANGRRSSPSTSRRSCWTGCRRRRVSAGFIDGVVAGLAQLPERGARRLGRRRRWRSGLRAARADAARTRDLPRSAGRDASVGRSPSMCESTQR